MTTLALLWFDCSRCGNYFLSYVEGKRSRCEEHVEEGDCFEPFDMSPIHGNNVLNAIKNTRYCRKCRKGQDIMSFV